MIIKMNYYAHPTAVIDEGCVIGDGTKIWHFCHVMKDARLGENCNLGQNVFVASGVVIFAGRHPAYGNMIDIDHGNGYTTRYAHNDQNLVKVGDVVTAGQLVAKMGSTGRATGSHLHFEVWFEGKPINPKKFVSVIR